MADGEWNDATDHDDLVATIREALGPRPTPPKGPWVRILSVLLGCLLVFELVGVAGGLVYYWLHRVYDPLSFPVDTKINLPPGPDNLPVVSLGKDIPVTFTKCSTGDVNTTRQSYYIPISPVTASIPAGSGPSHFPKGCYTATGLAHPPQAFIDRNRQLFGEGYTHVVWRIEAIYTPESKRKTVPRTLSTEEFEVLAPRPRRSP